MGEAEMLQKVVPLCRVRAIRGRVVKEGLHFL
jgi:hypothetical protein